MRKLKKLPLLDRVLARVEGLARLVGLGLIDVALLGAVLVLAFLTLWALGMNSPMVLWMMFGAAIAACVGVIWLYVISRGE